MLSCPFMSQYYHVGASKEEPEEGEEDDTMDVKKFMKVVKKVWTGLDNNPDEHLYHTYLYDTRI